MNDDVLLIVINMRSFEYTVQKRIRIYLNLIKTMENSWPNIKKVPIYGTLLTNGGSGQN